MAEASRSAALPTATQPRIPSVSRFQVRAGIWLVAIGVVVFVIGAKPEWLNLDRSPVIGFVQIAVFLVGLAIIAAGGAMSLNALWAGREKSIAADIGMRLVATGYVVALFAGMADVFGLGSHPLPQVPFFGPWQSLGVQIGQVIMVIGLLMFTPYHRHTPQG
jgi:hypothetical protein